MKLQARGVFRGLPRISETPKIWLTVEMTINLQITTFEIYTSVKQQITFDLAGQVRAE